MRLRDRQMFQLRIIVIHKDHFSITFTSHTAWTEKKLYDYQRSWKGYDFDILNELADDGATSDSKRAKPVAFILTINIPYDIINA